MARIKKASDGMTIDDIKNMMMTNDRVLYRGVVAIFEGQTLDEQESEYTSHSNSVGYNSIDADIMSSFAKQLIARGFPTNRFAGLSAKQRELARKKMMKYAGQLLELHEAKIQDKVVMQGA